MKSEIRKRKDGRNSKRKEKRGDESKLKVRVFKKSKGNLKNEA